MPMERIEEAFNSFMHVPASHSCNMFAQFRRIFPAQTLVSDAFFPFSNFLESPFLKSIISATCMIKKVFYDNLYGLIWCGLTPKSLWHADFIEGWNFCQLEILECKEVPWPNVVIEKQYGIEDCGWLSKDVAYECRINLLTGRTHQVFHLFPLFLI